MTRRKHGPETLASFIDTGDKEQPSMSAKPKRPAAETIAERDERRGCCWTCRFWEHAEELAPEERNETGLCRRLPPVVLPANAIGLPVPGRWPSTKLSDWCGSFEKAEATV